MLPLWTLLNRTTMWTLLNQTTMWALLSRALQRDRPHRFLIPTNLRSLPLANCRRHTATMWLIRPPALDRNIPGTQHKKGRTAIARSQQWRSSPTTRRKAHNKQCMNPNAMLLENSHSDKTQCLHSSLSWPTLRMMRRNNTPV